MNLKLKDFDTLDIIIGTLILIAVALWVFGCQIKRTSQEAPGLQPPRVTVQRNVNRHPGAVRVSASKGMVEVRP